MKAIVQEAYGSPDVLRLKEIGKPAVKKNEVLVRVHAAALHAGDVYVMRGKPVAARTTVGLFKPKRNYIPGFDVAGEVKTVGTDVTKLQPGDEVFGTSSGACVEYVCAAENMFIQKPANLTFEQAAALPTSGVTALRALRDVGKVGSGQKILINGASGGVGTFAVQIGKSLGAEITGVCSTRNVDMVRSIGADHVIDYTREDFTRGGQRYDLILDNVASRSFTEYRRALTPRGALLPNSGHGGMRYIIDAMVRSIFVRQKVKLFVAIPKHEDLADLKELVESGKVTPVIDRTYTLSEVPEAMRYLGEGHARGKVVITL
jgi:NADPH:quinone reductase-like Zn-dependent oxidoreductase